MIIEAINTITVRGIPSVPALERNIRTGDVIEFQVQSTNEDSSTGIINYRGQPIEAKLPPNLAPGNIIRAEVMIENETVQLKIIDIQNAEVGRRVSSVNQSGNSYNVSNDVTKFLSKIETELSSFLQDQFKLFQALAALRTVQISPNSFQEPQFKYLESYLFDADMEFPETTNGEASTEIAKNTTAQGANSTTGQLYDVLNSLLTTKGVAAIEKLAEHIKRASFGESNSTLEQVKDALLQYQSKLLLSSTAESGVNATDIRHISNAVGTTLVDIATTKPQVINDIADNVIALLKESPIENEKVKLFISNNLQTLPPKTQQEILGKILEKFPQDSPRSEHQENIKHGLQNNPQNTVQDMAQNNVRQSLSQNYHREINQQVNPLMTNQVKSTNVQANPQSNFPTTSQANSITTQANSQTENTQTAPSSMIFRDLLSDLQNNNQPTINDRDAGSKIYQFLQQISRELTKRTTTDIFQASSGTIKTTESNTAQNTIAPLKNHIEIIKNSVPADAIGAESNKIKFLQNIALLRGAERVENIGVAVQQFQQLITQVDKMIAADSMATGLNSVLQSLGEPALVLFPFLLQGFLAQANIWIDNDASKHGSGNAKDASGKSLPFQKIRTAVSLPNLGLIDVNIAYRDKEMMLHLTSEDAEVSEFLESQTPMLTSILEAGGYENIQIRTICEKPTPLTNTALINIGQTKLMV